MSSDAEVKGYLLSRICPVFVTDAGKADYTYRPRLWGHFTIHFAVWYCNVFRREDPVVIPGKTYRL